MACLFIMINKGMAEALCNQGAACPEGQFCDLQSGQLRECEGDFYCPGSSCKAEPCPEGYRNSPPGASAITQCFAHCDAGQWVQTAQAGCAPIPAGTGDNARWSSAHNVNWGTISSINLCPANYRNTNPGANAITQCFASCSAGQWVQTIHSPCINIVPGDGTNTGNNARWSAQHNVNYGNTSTNEQAPLCPENYQNIRSPADAQNRCFTQCTAGQWVQPAQAACADIPAGTGDNARWSNAHNVNWSQTSVENHLCGWNDTTCAGIRPCPANYLNTPAPTSSLFNDKQERCFTRCAANFHVATANAACVECVVGRFSEQHDVNFGSTSVNECRSCPAGCTTAGLGLPCDRAKPGFRFVQTGQPCSPCPVGWFCTGGTATPQACPFGCTTATPGPSGGARDIAGCGVNNRIQVCGNDGNDGCIKLPAAVRPHSHPACPGEGSSSPPNFDDISITDPGGHIPVF